MSAVDTAQQPAVNGSERLVPAPSAAPPSPVHRQGPTPIRTSRVVLKRVDPWSVLKVSILFYLSGCIVLITAGVLLWAAATSIDIIGNIESFMDSIGFTDFRFEGGQILRGAGLGGLVLVIAGTFGNVLMAVLYNLISEVVGGLRITLAEDEVRSRRI